MPAGTGATLVARGSKPQATKANTFRSEECYSLRKRRTGYRNICSPAEQRCALDAAMYVFLAGFDFLAEPVPLGGSARPEEGWIWVRSPST